MDRVQNASDLSGDSTQNPLRSLGVALSKLEDIQILGKLVYSKAFADESTLSIASKL